jgi:hypothetical protein
MVFATRFFVRTNDCYRVKNLASALAIFGARYGRYCAGARLRRMMRARWFQVSTLSLAAAVFVQACVAAEPTRLRDGDAGLPPASLDSGELTLDSGARDAGGDGASVDAGPIMRCDPDKEFGTPTPLAGTVNTAASEDGARVSPDGAYLYVSRQDGLSPKSIRVYRFSKNAQNEWDNGKAEAGLSVPSVDAPAVGETNVGFMTFLSDKRALYSVFRSPWAVYAATYVDDRWVTEGTSVLRDIEFPWFNVSSQRLYFMRSSAGAYRLFVATRGANEFQGVNPQALSLRGTGSGGEYAPVVSADDLTIYFSNADGTARRVHRAKRRVVAENFGEALPIPSINAGTTFTQPTWLSNDGCEMYLTRSVNNNGEIYVARKPN